MIFWSFVAGVITFYCSFGPDYLLPNMLFMLKLKTKVTSDFICVVFRLSGTVQLISQGEPLLVEVFAAYF